jgi:large subunit ribosomal protein L11
MKIDLFDFIFKQPPASILILEAAKIKKGSENSIKNKVGKITKVNLDKLQKRKCQILMQVQSKLRKKNYCWNR